MHSTSNSYGCETGCFVITLTSASANLPISTSALAIGSVGPGNCFIYSRLCQQPTCPRLNLFLMLTWAGYLLRCVSSLHGIKPLVDGLGIKHFDLEASHLYVLELLSMPGANYQVRDGQDPRLALLSSMCMSFWDSCTTRALHLAEVLPPPGQRKK